MGHFIRHLQLLGNANIKSANHMAAANQISNRSSEWGTKVVYMALDVVPDVGTR